MLQLKVLLSIRTGVTGREFFPTPSQRSKANLGILPFPGWHGIQKRQAVITQRFHLECVIRAFGNRHSLIIIQRDGGEGLVYRYLSFSTCGLVTYSVVDCIFSVS